jgi:lysophospholipase L1-like esterase
VTDPGPLPAPRPPSPRRARAAAVAAALAAGLVLVVAAAAPPAGATRTARPASPARPAIPPVRPTRVLVLGDSVMEGARSLYAGALPGRDVVVDTAVNRTTGQGADLVARIGADWDVVVVLLAHNDGGSPGVYQPAANRLLDELGRVPRVVWLTLHEVRPYYVGVNQFLRDQGARRPNVEVGDWNALLAQHPGAVAGDGLHLSGEGPSLMASFVAAIVQVAEVQLAPPPTTTTTTTTTTLPPTTTVPATTTTEAVALIPATSIDRTPRSTTTVPHDGADPAGDGGAADGVVLGGALVAAAGAAAAGATMFGRRSRRRSGEPGS